jgi:dienelactone hydrolase
MRQLGLPDFVNATLGGAISILWGIRTRCSATNVDEDLRQIVEPNVKRSGCELVGVTGFCFGGWVVGRCLALNNGRSIFAAGVGIHPSLQTESFAAGGTRPIDLARATQNKPILLLASTQDNDAKPSSPIVQAMAKRRAKTPDQLSIEFDLPHGFVARGDFMGPTFKDGQEKAIQLTVDFFLEHLKL